MHVILSSWDLILQDKDGWKDVIDDLIIGAMDFIEYHVVLRL